MTTSTSLHSNAFNFMSFISGGVDPRTGLYTVSIALPELKTEDLAGPTVPLALAFNPLNTRDAGYGMGWSLQLSQFSPASQILSLGTGETFKVTETAPDGRLLMKEQKLDSFHAYDQGNGFYRVAHKSGLVEILQMLGSAAEPVALPVEIQSADGRAVTLAYDTFNGQPLLSEVRDSRRRLLSLTRSSGAVEVRLHPDEVNVRFVLELSDADHRVARLVLPTEEQARWAFTYRTLNGLLCISEVRTPAGAHEILYYDDAGHAFPGATGRPGLPRVNRHVSDPGHGQPPVEVHYAYGTATVPNTHNFLGHDAAGLIFEDNGLDNLYRITEAYLYGTTETLMDGGQAVRRIERTFNRFHLMTEQRVTQGRNVKTTSTVYHADDELSFDQQPAYCQLPFTATDTWSSLDDANRVRHETVTTTYDMFGNLLEQIQANGVIETSTWYPVEGENGLCPPDPEGFVRQLASRTVTPAASTHGDPSPVLRTRYRYDALPPVSGADRPWLVLSEEALLQVDSAKTSAARQETSQEVTRLLQHVLAPSMAARLVALIETALLQEAPHETSLHLTRRTYINDPADALNHGRPLQERFTLNGIDTVTDYAYVKTAARHVEETVLRTTQTLSSSLDDERKIITLEHSLLSGEALLTRDDTDVEIRYQYDALGRVVAETVAPGNKEYEATRNYRYHLAAHDQDQAWQEVVNVKDVTVRSELDGLNRVVRELRQDADGNNALRDTYAAQYDGRGQLISETQIDWMIGQNTLKLTRHFGYDDWGQQVSETGPDGVVSFKETDQIASPDGPVTREWLQHSIDATEKYNLTVTQLNLFGDPTSVERFDRLEQSGGSHFSHYDGLGRLAEEIDALNHVTGYRYDAFDRQVQHILPDKAVVKRTYAPHSIEDLPILISVNDNVLGEQAFDSLDRRWRTVTGGRKQTYKFKTGQSRPCSVETARGQTIDYVYNPALGEEPLQRTIVDSPISAAYRYDPKNARLMECDEQDQKLGREYFSNGELKSETRTSGTEVHTMHYLYSLEGRLLEYKDVLGQVQTYTYDSYGRIQKTELQDAISGTFFHDPLGQVQRIETVSGEQQVMTALEYDDFGRETQRSFDLDGVIQVMTQVWDNTDQLKQRTLKQGDTLLRDEVYSYDSRGRLTGYTCSGSQPPVDAYGKAITSQLFRFDILDNMTQVRTVFDGGSNIATYHFENDKDPTQLSRVSNSYPDYPAEIKLLYDADGNLLQDEAKRTLTYDALNRLTSVSAPGGGPVDTGDYRYDPLDTLSGHGDDQRFYNAGQLSTRLTGDKPCSYLRGGPHLLADTDKGMTAGDHNNTVLYGVGNGTVEPSAYTAYGYRTASGSKQGGAGFNGEYGEPGTDWQLLGNGYRAYNPVLMKFHSPDSLSPFDEGGVNAYAYCEGDPVNGVDPSGHGFWSGLGRALGIKPTLKVGTAGVNGMPGIFTSLGKGKQVSRLRTVKSTDIENFNVISKHRQNVADRAEASFFKSERAGYSGKKLNEKWAQRDVALSDAEQARADLKALTALKGKPGITKQSRMNIVDEVQNINTAESKRAAGKPAESSGTAQDMERRNAYLASQENKRTRQSQ
ncbi:RHS repeat domain-containing protein [Pseudomonas viridiflava]